MADVPGSAAIGRSSVNLYQSFCLVCDCIAYSLPGELSSSSSHAYPGDIVIRSAIVMRALRGSGFANGAYRAKSGYTSDCGDNGAPSSIARPSINVVTLFPAERTSCGRFASNPKK